MALTLTPYTHESRAWYSKKDFASSPEGLGPMTLEEMVEVEEPVYSWDLEKSFSSMTRALQYISAKLARKDIHVAVIATSQTPTLIPVWPLTTQSQSIFYKIISRAAKKFDISQAWLNALSGLCQKTSPARILAAHVDISYIINRSLIQHDVLFGGEGLTLLSVDHVFTFKNLLSLLDRADWVPLSREPCMESCLQLLHRLNTIYDLHGISKAYLQRAYDHVSVSDTIIAEVARKYMSKFGNSGILGMLPERDECGDHETWGRSVSTVGSVFDSHRVASHLDLPKLFTKGLGINAGSDASSVSSASCNHGKSPETSRRWSAKTVEYPAIPKPSPYLASPASVTSVSSFSSGSSSASITSRSSSNSGSSTSSRSSNASKASNASSMSSVGLPSSPSAFLMKRTARSETSSLASSALAMRPAPLFSSPSLSSTTSTAPSSPTGSFIFSRGGTPALSEAPSSSTSSASSIKSAMKCHSCQCNPKSKKAVKVTFVPNTPGTPQSVDRSLDKILY
ncbi:hypothetical protein MMC09_002659 [Bachmanniomyces sp. S44760]|nr:hypothetical protein [Bachmanniomyces sp. S44760]